MASLGAKVLQTRSVEMAMKQDVPVQVLSSLEPPIGSDLPGTLVTREEDIMEQEIVTGITYAGDEAKVMLMDIPDLPGMAAKIFGPLADANINVDMIVQNASADGKSADVTFTVSRGDLPRALEAIKSQPELAKVELRTSTKVAKVSVVGIGMRSHAGVAQTMFKALSEKGINIEVISTSEIKISVLISEDYTELAVRSLHSAYKLEKAKKLS
jgi:aspartate kinase